MPFLFFETTNELHTQTYGIVVSEVDTHTHTHTHIQYNNDFKYH